MTTIQHLKASGLSVTRVSSRHDQAVRYRIHLPQVFLSRVPDQTPLRVHASNMTLADVAPAVYDHEDGWMFELWERVPGPDESDFRAPFPCLDDALRAVYDFYFGVPTRIDQWNVPLHRHPELVLHRVTEAIADAVHVHADAFLRICERRTAQVFGPFAPLLLTQGKTRWEQAIQAQFLTIHHHQRTDIRLCLRRDAHEGYIVDA